MDGVGVPPLFLLHDNLPVSSPAAELLAFLQSEPRSLQQVREMGISLATALAQLEHHPFGAGVQIQGQTLGWIGESDFRKFWVALHNDRLEAAWSMYGLFLPGFQSALRPFVEWLELERRRMLAGLLDVSLIHAEQAFQLAERELSNPTDKTRALAACLLQAEFFLRRSQGKEAVWILGKALGLQEYMGQGFSGLSLALLAEAHACWNRPRKAEGTARKAQERASDPYTQSRVHFARYRALHNRADLQATRHEAEQAGFKHWINFLSTQS